MAAVASIMASPAVCMQPWPDGGGGLLGAPFACASSAAGLCQSSQAPSPTGARRMDTTAEHRIDFALESEPHCGSWSLHAVSVATEFLHQDMWSGVRVGNLFPHTQLVPMEYRVRLGKTVCPMMLLASEPGFLVR